MLNKMKIKVVAGVLVVFLCGLLLGALGTSLVVARQIKKFAEGGASARRTWIMRRLNRQLHLTETQRQAVQQIVDRTEEEISNLLRRAMSEFAEILRRQNAEIRPLLTPEQQQKLDSMAKQTPPHVFPAPPSEKTPQ